MTWEEHAPASEAELRAVRRWRPGRRWYHPLLAQAVIQTSRFVMRVMNRLEFAGAERFEAAQDRGSRGLLTFSNHVSLFDDPLLISNLSLQPYDRVRWIAADALNFFGSPFKSWLFTAGKAVPIVRGSGVEQPGLAFLAERLREGQWVHIFPEGGRTRDPLARLSTPFKPGIGRLLDAARPIALPFYHYGMQRVLPVSSRMPRPGHRVRVVFGEAIDCGDAYIEQLSRSASPPAAGMALWQLLAGQAEAALLRLQATAHPEAGDR